MNRIKLFVAIVFACVLMPTALAAQALSPFAGNWRGDGSVITDSGKKENVKCRADNGLLKSGQFAIVLKCTTAGGGIELRSKVVESAGVLKGDWKDVTYNNEGTLGGKVAGDVLDAKISGPVINGNVKVRRDGATLHVNASLSKGVKSISVAMKK